MRVLRIEVDGFTTSFRHPHFLMGRQPSYPLPPPATILGHIASALGEYPDPAGLRFAYSFNALGRVDDMENIYLASPGGAVPREARSTWPHRVNLTAAMNPLLREILYAPHLVLYLHAPELLDDLFRAFREPRYTVALGRSQDLASYRSVGFIDSARAEAGYLEGTLLPYQERGRFTQVPLVTMLMPRYIDPAERSRVQWSPYALVQQRVPVARAAAPPEGYEIDPESPRIGRGLCRILVWHSFTADPSALAFEGF